MATLVLTAVGAAIGGPLGGAIGAAIGKQVDNALFAPKPREGARLKELDIQVSSYGSQIPACFGKMRVAGTVFWATDLVERRAKSGGGKGRPSTVNFSYSVSIAVALSSRPILRVGRIWADGNLIRGSAGDLKVDTQLRVYTGHGDQKLDPLMASAEEMQHCPAYSGIAYAMFEDLQLADFGNRIPSLTFELFERDTAVPVAEIFYEATGGLVAGESQQSVDGFAMSGPTAREPLALLNESFAMECRTRGRDLLVGEVPQLHRYPHLVDPAVSENSTRFDSLRETIEPASRVPHVMTLRYYDSERDFQTSLQRSFRGASSAIEYSIELPAVLDTATAKRIIEGRLLDIQNQRRNWRGDVALSKERYYPGDYFVDANGGTWQIVQIEHRFGSAEIMARAVRSSANLPEFVVTPGRTVSSPDLPIGKTRIVALELPVIGLTDPAKPIVAVFAAGTGAGWRRAALSLGANSAQIDLGATAHSAIIGSSLEPLTSHEPHLVDERRGLRVQVLNSGMDIANRTGSPLDIDAPLFWLSGEFIRYGNCEDLGSGVYRFSRLLRGCFGSDDNVVLHPVSAPFVLIESESARILDERLFGVGDTIQVEALGLGDEEPAKSSMQVHALATTPFAPVHGGMRRTADGGLTVRWIRRARIDNGWKDGIDQMMPEERERYRVSLFADDNLVSENFAEQPELTLSGSQWSEMGLDDSVSIRAEIRQLGRYAVSAPLTIHLPAGSRSTF
ncbi:MAG: phage tail protein [Sphingorhabdus sp.]|uniref:GTA baseplate fiber-binding domain-containing protein n=1 Tax=Sphingorhabdus sp. TaxID=1902408 RepID=UPI0038FCD701